MKTCDRPLEFGNMAWVGRGNKGWVRSICYHPAPVGRCCSPVTRVYVAQASQKDKYDNNDLHQLGIASVSVHGHKPFEPFYLLLLFSVVSAMMCTA